MIPGKYYHLDGYEPRVMNFYGYIPDYFDEILRSLLESLQQVAPDGTAPARQNER